MDGGIKAHDIHDLNILLLKHNQCVHGSKKKIRGLVVKREGTRRCRECF